MNTYYNGQSESVISAVKRHLESPEFYDGGHCARVSDWAVRFGKSLRLRPDDIEGLRVGGLVHDIGKMAIPEAILSKPGPLNQEETQIVRQHTVLGEQMCAQLTALHSILPMVRNHHERMNGTGYPDGLQGNSIPKTVRILQMVDIFDALTNDRPYRKNLSMPQALSVLYDEADRGWMDRFLVNQFASFVIAAENTANFRNRKTVSVHENVARSARKSASRSSRE
jgi:putative two-component system response regulator